MPRAPKKRKNARQVAARLLPDSVGWQVSSFIDFSSSRGYPRRNKCEKRARRGCFGLSVLFISLEARVGASEQIRRRTRSTQRERSKNVAKQLLIDYLLTAVKVVRVSNKQVFIIDYEVLRGQTARVGSYVSGDEYQPTVCYVIGQDLPLLCSDANRPFNNSWSTL